jgi:bacterioferritin (cytochrome b1)
MCTSHLLSCTWQVDMEQDYVTAAFFRHAISQRQQHLQQLEDMQQIMDGAGRACLVVLCALHVPLGLCSPVADVQASR